MVFVKVFLVIFFLGLVNSWYKAKKKNRNWVIQQEIKNSAMAGVFFALFALLLSFIADDIVGWFSGR